MPYYTYEEIAKIKKEAYDRGYREGQNDKVKEIDEFYEDDYK